jgi:hypothetical protein
MFCLDTTVLSWFGETLPDITYDNPTSCHKVCHSEDKTWDNSMKLARCINLAATRHMIFWST